MKIDTLKKLINQRYENTDNIQKFRDEVISLIDVFHMDTDNTQSNLKYSDVCCCNVKNGGRGVCGCVLGNVDLDCLQRLYPEN